MLTQDQLKQLSTAGHETEVQVYVNYLKKIKAGSALKAKDRADLERLQAELQTALDDLSIPDKVDAESLIVTSLQVAWLFGVTRQAVQHWLALGCPGKLGRAQWDLKQVISWWLENIYTGNTSEDESLRGAQRKYWVEHAECERIKVAKEKESVFPRSEVARAWTWRVGEVTSGLSSLVVRLPPLLEGKTQGQMRAILDSEVWKLRDNFCRSGKFCPPVAVKKSITTGRKRKHALPKR